jgi:hypothetical protein
MALLSIRSLSFRAFCAGLVAAAALGTTTAAYGYHTHFVANNCKTTSPAPTSTFTRQGSINVATVGANEGYQWGGGCWDDNNIDDSPGDPTQDPATGGEGGDCSGFTFKVWRESLNSADAGAYQWGKLRNVHGPYSAQSFKDGDGAPNVTYGKSGLIRMDALASTSHIGMIFATNADGSDQIVEAKGEAYGTNIWTRTYRGSTSFTGVRRLGWTG